MLRKKVERSRSFPLSFCQQRLWVLDRLEPGNPVYNIPLAMWLRGPLDVDALQHTVNEVVARHESLRTKIVLMDDQPKQVIQAAQPQKLTVLDLEHIDPAAREAEAVARGQAEAQKSFRLEEGPLYRALLLRFSPTEHVLIVVLHHIISDDWSVAVLFRELAVLYHAFKAGLPSPLQPLPIQYADYAVWQRQRLQGEELQRLLDYWCPQLQNVPPLDFPTDQPRSSDAPQTGETESWRLSPALADRLRELARREEATLYMVLLAAFQTLLYRYSGQEDFAVGSPIAGRVGKQTEQMVGFFVNTLVLRADLRDAPSFRRLLGRVRETALNAFEHQELPFERLVEALNPDRESGRHPLFQAMFILQSVPWPVVEFDQLSFTPLSIHTGTAKFELSFTAREDRDGMLVTAEYRSSLFHAATIRRMLRHFQNLLESIVADPDQLVSQLTLLDKAERQTLLVEQNATRRAYPAGMLLQRLFEVQAKRTPDAVAVVFEDRQLTYRQLNQRANQLASRLRSLSIGPSAIVGIYLERSLELVVGLLGVLKAGGAYVPVDPSYPADRVEFMLADGPVPLVLTQQRLAGTLGGYSGRVLTLDGEQDPDADGAAYDADFVCPATEDDAAYVLYTSGSTGRPKGVVITHRAICNHMFWMAEEYPLEPGDALLQKTPISFDPSVWEFYAPLIVGARLVMAQPYGHMDPRYLTQAIQQQQITILRVVPTLLQMLVAEPSFAQCTSLRRVLVGGEALPTDLVLRARAAIGAEVCNMYGPTEAAIVAASFRWDGRTEGATVPIGRPMANAEAYVLDKSRQLVPMGVPGELYLGGVGLARGYLNRPELTAERFVPHPFRSEPEARLYRTGDLVRWLPDGNLEFLGRLDQQVKIRGNRIELGEVQSVLANHPGVRKAVVTAFDNGSGGKELAAYWVAEAPVPPVEQLRDFLRKSLPEYMIPSVFVALDAIPLLPNGKVDYKSLPRPAHQRDARCPYVPPRTPEEELLADIWREVLHVEQVSIHDNFFALGGHSLLATQVVSRITRGLHVEVPLREMFQTPTIAELAQRLAVIRSHGETSCAEPIPAVSRDGDLPASFAQEALWVVEQLNPGSAVYNVPLAVRLQGQLDADALNRALNEVVGRHEPLRTKMALRDGKPIQVIEAAQLQELTIVDLQHLAAAEREAEALSRAATEARRPFRLDAGPLFRALLLRLSPTEHVLVLVMHHIISDDWSMGVLFSDVVALYQAFTAGRPSPLTSLAIQYADYAVWQRQRLQGEPLQRLRDYWRPRLEGVAPLELPTDRPRCSQASSAGGTLETVLPAALTAQLKEVGRREGATLYMTLLAAFQVLLHRYSGQEDFAVGSPIANRLRPEIEGLIGYFINVVVLRANLAGDPTFRDLLVRVRQNSLEAFEHQELPFEQLVEAVNPARDAGRHPLFQVLFTLQNAPRPQVKLADLDFSVIPLDTDTSKFELSFTAWEEGGALVLSVEYDSHLFGADTIQRMIEHFQTLLEGIVNDADRPLSRLPLMDQEPQRQLLGQWNDTAREFDRSRCVHQLFEGQAEQCPGATAVVGDDRAWTYGELNRRANQLARYLQRQGVGPEVRVGICLERSPELVLAVLGVLKAGGAYVPLDAAYTQDAEERTRFVLQDAQVSLVLTQSALSASLEGSETPRVLLDGEGAERMAAESGENLGGGASVDNLAYVLYTSGSTGRPKGVMVTHGNLLNAYFGWQQEYRLDTEVRSHLQMASFGFDVFAGDWVRALCSGGKLVICQKEVLLEPAKLLPLMRREQVDGAEFVPVVLRTLVQHLEETDQSLDFMRLVVVGSDAWFVADHQRARRVLGPATRLINSYGLTETTIDSSYFEGEVSATISGLVPIGRPFPNVRLYILDAAMQPVPIGVPGELYIGGQGVARGYVDTELNAARYVADPFVSEAGARLCRTGDRARWRADGQVEFLGRVDDQVKIRGFRIEPGEVEQVLREHPQLAEAAVAVRERVPGEPQLVAYTSARDGQSPDAAELRQFLRQRLPEYMIPSLFVVLPCLPVTSSGKVDRRALPDPDWSAVPRECEYVAPRTPDEQRLAAIWCEVLHAAQVGVHDNFFALGGHSLLAAQVMSRITRELNVSLPFRDLFLAPTIAELAQRVAAARGAGQAYGSDRIPPAPRDGVIPTSFMQESLWVVDQLEPGSAAYNIPLALRLCGSLDTEILNRALNEVVARHESLRTKIAVQDGSPMQVIEAPQTRQLTIIDLQELEAADREAAALARARAEAGRPFRLEEGPLFRVLLLRLSPTEHVLVLVMHHIISDEWSMGVLFSDIVALYRAMAADQPSPLPDLAIQYADYAVWQRERLQGEAMQSLLDYWCPRLAGVAPLELPADQPRSLRAFRAGGTYQTTLPLALLQQVLEAAQREGATLYMTLMAAFQVLLYRYSGQEDFAVGSPIANRVRPEIEPLIGYFINMVVLRANLAGNPTFRQLLGQVRQDALEAIEHQELPFERLVGALNPARDADRHPLFQVVFSLENAPSPDMASAGIDLDVIPLDTATSKFDLSLTAREEREGLLLQVEYDSHLFRPDTIERMIAHFRILLEGIVANVDTPASQIPLLTETDRRQLLVEWNDAAQEPPSALCVPDGFEEQVKRTPDSPALVDGERRWTYRELDAWANQLAHYLQQRGVGPDQLVAIQLPRSPELIVGLLGILKAGGAYLPLDPESPAERRRFTLEDARVEVLITQERMRSESPGGLRHVICLDTERDGIAQCPTDPPPRQTVGEHLAYVIYTSGSTGRPKGVMIEHAALANYTQAAVEQYGVTAADRVLQFASVSFDAHVEEVYPCLTQGGTLILRNDEMLDCRRFLQLCEQWQLTFVSLPTGFWHELTIAMEAEGLTVPPSLRLVAIGGEAASPERVATWFRHVGSRVSLQNTYGPTEATVVATAAELSREDGRERRVPIGRPLSNTRAYVLDHLRQPVPVGVPGELYVGGWSLARGYLNRPELTEDRFVTDPHVGNGARMYRTGDVVRWRPDGRLEFMGRTDHQVKIRGFRIEPGEIEQVLREHALLADAAVVVRERSPGDQQLVAYVAGRDEGAPAAAEMRQFLRERLPEYMIPSVFVAMPALPMTTSGKVDRRVLPPPDWNAEGAAREGQIAALSTPTEEQLAAVWSELLNIEKIGADDNFFDLGGNSLLALRMISRVRQVFPVDPPPATIFTSPTLRQFAARIVAFQESPHTSVQLPMRPVPRDEPLPASFAQEPFWFLQQLAPSANDLNMHAVMSFQGPLDIDALRETLNEVVRRHESLRTRFVLTESGELMQVIVPHLQIDLPWVDLSQLPQPDRQQQIERYSQEQAEPAFDLGQLPLLRLRVLRLSDTEHILLLTSHHIICDGWSVDVLGQEVAQIYQARLLGRPAPLPELPLQYADYAVWQRQYLQGPVRDSLLDYWRNKLEGLTALELPTDHPRRAAAQYRQVGHSFRIPQRIKTRLGRLCSEQGVTPFMALLAAFQVLLHRYSDSDDIAVGSLSANRHQTETQGMVGLFTNTIIMRNDLSGDPSFRALLGRVAQTAIEAFEHQEMRYELLAKELQPGHDLTKQALVQVWFVFQQFNAEREMAISRDLTVEVQEEERAWESAEVYDLTLSVADEAQGFQCQFDYDAALFDRETIARMAAHFQTLLDAILPDPDQPISQLPLLTESERTQVITGWNETEVDFHHDGCVHQLFETQAERTPDAAALVCEGRTISYRQLNAQANQLAQYLVSRGVGPEVFVGVCLEPSFDLAVALLGVLKAGGAYVPLDPEDPPERLDFFVADSRPAVIVTKTDWRERLSAPDARWVCLDSEHDEIMRERPADLPCPASATTAVSVLYTSGSTGKPKGAVNMHRGVCNYLLFKRQLLGLEPSDRMLFTTPISFDTSVEEFFLPLISGGCLVIAKAGSQREPGYLARLIASENVTTACFVPTMLRFLLEDPQGCGSLKHVISGGEALTPDLVERFFQLLDADLYNDYGPTETSIAVATWKCRRDYPRGIIPIGRPISNVRLYVLDAARKPVPVGVPGELYIGGVAVGRGYLNRPELNAERFLPDPFGSSEADRVYRTGDRCRWLPDGNLEFLGRRDGQVKIHGARVELGEVEAVICGHPNIAHAAVVARESSPGLHYLAAYVVPRLAPADGADAVREFVDDVRRFLQALVPAYLIPQAFEVLEALPQLPSGKVNRGALPDVAPVAKPATRYVSPRSPLEQQLAAIWAEVLGCERVGLYDNFFELGGHSLLAVRMASRVRSVLAVDLPLVTLFAAPTLVELAERIEALQAAGCLPGLPPIQKVSRDQPLPLSYGQEALWIIDHLEEGPSPYVTFPAARIRGPLNVPALERALNEIWRRHESLRTTFQEVDGRPVQVIAPYAPQSLTVTDLSALPAEERETAVQRFAEAQSQRPIDLAVGPLARLELLKLSDDEHVVLIGMHHIIYDGWSMAVLDRELLLAYGAFHAGLPSPLEQLPIQYADYAVWQRERLQGETLESLQRYWGDQLKDLPTLELPTDHPRSPMRTTRGASCHCQLSRELSNDVAQLSREAGGTPFMTLVAAFQTLLHRYTGQDDFPIGTPVAGRLRPETEPLIGYFVNTLVLRANLSGDPSFRDFLHRVRDTVLQAFDHQELPFERLVQDLRPLRDPSRHPVFQVMFDFQNTPFEPEELPALPGLEMSGQETHLLKMAEDLDLVMVVHENEEGIHVSLDYRTDLFDESTIRRMLQHYRTLLEAAVADSNRLLSLLPLMGEDERRMLLLEWNRTEVEWPHQLGLQQVFEQQVRQRPDAVAVVFEGEALTYRELNAQANQLAHYLRGCGVGPEVLVGICLERSLGMAVALLGVLKAGGAYVPLDPDYPRERLDYVMADSRPAVLLTTSDLADRISSAGAGLTVYLDTQRDEISRASDANPPCQTGPDNAIYVIYTSGSTGTPKGAINLHRGLRNNLLWETQFLGLDAADRVLFKTPLSFDVSVVEFFRGLLCGGRVVMAKPGGQRDPQYLAELMAREQVTTAEFVPSMLRALLDENHLQRCGSLKRICSGAEALAPDLVKSFFRQLRIPLFNIYGPTETSVGVSGWKCLPEEDIGFVPIGRPVSNVRLYILDERREPVPVGVPGELYVGGVAVGRGYLNRPELDAERFLPDPFSGLAEDRLYKTGDRCRYLPDGNIEYLGRLDEQVKIRGFRIESGEIEGVLKQDPDVREAAVIAWHRDAGDLCLVAYFVPRPGAELARERLWSLLESRLPPFMVPSFLVRIEAWPLLPNGKVDRRALPAPDDDARAASTAYVGPRSEAERQLAGIWQEVLHVEQVGAHDNFFALGGHSLLALSMISRVRREFSIALPVATLFEAPTLSELAERITALQESGRLPELPAIPRVARDAPLPMSYGQEGIWRMNKLQEGPSPYVAFPAARVRGPLNVPALERALNEVLRRHESLRTTFAEVDGRPVQVIAPHTPQPLSVIDLSQVPAGQQEEQVRRYARSQSQRPIDLSAGPLARVELLRLSAEEHVVLIGIHQIINDGWSMAVLDRELLTAYRALAAGFPSPLPDLPVQYADYAVWQRQRLQGDVLEVLLSYWRKQLAGLPALELPADRPRPAVRTTHGAMCGRQLPRPLMAAVKQLGQQERATVFMALVAAFQTLLHRYSGQEDFPIGTPVAGRLRPETEGLIGYFINSLVLRADLTGEPSFRQLLRRTRQTALAAIDHQELPFERLVQELDPNPALNRHPIFQVMIDFENTPFEAEEMPEMEFSGLQAEAWELGADLHLVLVLNENEEGMHLSLGYATALFDEATIVRMLEEFQTLLEGAVADPDQPISQLPLSRDQEERRMLVERHEPEARERTDASAASAASAEFAAPAFASPAQTIETQRLGKTDGADPIAAHLVRPPGANGRSLVPLRSGGTAAPLFCFHGLGGHVGIFLPLANGLAQERPVYGLQAQGLDLHQQPHDCLETMALFYLQEIRQVQARGPYYFAGWSMGGLIALEAAGQLRAAGEDVALVALLDTYLSDGDAVSHEIDEHSVIHWLAPQLDLSLETLSRLPPAEQWRQIAERANLAEGIEAAEIRRMAVVCQAHFTAFAAYRPRPYPGPAVLLSAGDAGELDARWRSLCPRLRAETVPGNHYSMLRRPHVDVLAARLSGFLGESNMPPGTGRNP